MSISVSSRIVLLFAVALVACVYMVSAAPIAIVNNGLQLGANIDSSSTRINMFKKVDDNAVEYTTTTSTATSTSISTSTKTSSTEEPTTTTTVDESTTTTKKPTTTTTVDESTTTTTNKASKTTTTTDSQEPTEAPVSKSSSSGSYTGDATWYNTGLGSCGWDNKESELIVAVNHEQMGQVPNPNKNSNCGRFISVKGPKGSVNVKVVDTCPGCAHGALDLSPAAFAQIADLSQGRVTINWSWN
jgi:expansin (peptidoglycan-binding protein)